jgi:hypothetical protein
MIRLKTLLASLVQHVRLHRPWVVFVMGSTLGLGFFLLTFGYDVIIPTHIDWLLIGGDLKEHYVGWYFFRQSGWTFPFGMINMLSYPQGISVAYLDSIPLLALPFKLLSAYLPKTFQYFGLWGVICYMLQGGIGALIIRRWTRNWLVLLPASLLIVASPIMFARMYFHTSLAGHWIILLAILALLYASRLAPMRLFLLIWSIILVMAVLIHPYFMPMVVSILLIAIILNTTSWLSSIGKFVIPVTISAAVFGLVGGFAIASAEGDRLGFFAFNLLSPINPDSGIYPGSWSVLLKSQPLLSDSWETFNYLGLGILLLLVIATWLVVWDMRQLDRDGYKQLVTRFLRWKYVLVAGVVLGLLAMAISPVVQWGQWLIIDYTSHLPHIVERMWSIFRASGRLFWPIYYAIMIGLIAYFVTRLRRWPRLALGVFFLVVVTVQMVDVYAAAAPQAKLLYLHDATRETYHPALNVAAWGHYAQGKKHFIFLDGNGGMVTEMFGPLTDVTMKYNLTMNVGYFARSRSKDSAILQQTYIHQLRSGSENISDELFVTQDKALILAIQPRYQVVWLDSYALVYANKHD